MPKCSRRTTVTVANLLLSRSSSAFHQLLSCKSPSLALQLHFSVATLQSNSHKDDGRHNDCNGKRQDGNETELPIHHKIFKSPAKMGSYQSGDSSFYSLIETYANNCDFESLEKVLGRMKRENRVFLEKSFILVFRAYGKAGFPGKALELFDRMADEFQCKRTVKSFNSVLNVVIHAGLFRQALEFYDHVVSSKHVNISPNVLSFNLIIKALCKLGLVDKAIQVFRDMPVRQCDPDVYTYCTLMDGLCKEDRIDEAVSLLDEMQVEGCFPNPPTFNVLINGLCKKGDLARAGKLVDNMFFKGCVPSEVTYNTLIHGLCLKGKLDKAVSLLDRMVSSKCVPNEVTYGTVINGLVKQGKALEGVQVLVSLEHRGHSVNEYVFSTLISGLFKEGKPEDGMKLFKGMIEKRCKLNTVVYSVVIDGLCKDGKADEALEILSEMENKGIVPNAFTYSSLMKGFFEIGKSHKAIEVWKAMAKEKCVENDICYSVVIDGLCKTGSIEEAMIVWTQMLHKGCKPDVITYSSMIHGLCCSGSLEDALKLYNEMLCQEPNSQPDIVTYNILFDALCNRSSLSTAIDLLNRMLDRGVDPDVITCNIFLRALGEKIDPPQDGTEFLDELVVRLFKRQSTLGASQILGVMLQKFLLPKASTWGIAVQEFCRPKKVQVAIERCRNNVYGLVGLRRELDGRLRRVARYEVHALVIAAVATIPSSSMFPAMMNAAKSPSSILNSVFFRSSSHLLQLPLVGRVRQYVDRDLVSSPRKTATDLHNVHS
ncbi:unnamed protein product [Linum tenue]|uniref:Pentatricopeptide repeat-containing protein n=1 Tax=Linum tenue TaxID=586396 RepID=A0AAV0I957_9ROSI|nr:unnamed protein product [Linum tenue]